MRPEAGTAEVFAKEVFPDKPAIRAGMQAGDQIISVNGENVRNVEHFMTLVQTGKDGPLAIVVQRGAERVELTPTPEIQESGQAMIGESWKA